MTHRDDDITPVALVCFSILSFLLLIGAVKLEVNRFFSYSLLSSAFIISCWVCLVAMEKSAFSKWFWSFKSSSLVVGFLISSFVLYSSIKSYSIINEIFKIDASAFTFTRVIGYVTYSFGMVMPFFLTYLSVTFVVMIKQMIRPSEGDSGVKVPTILIFFINGLVLGLIGGPASYVFWDEELYKSRIEAIADLVDFGYHNCSNIPSENKVIFLDPGNTVVLEKKPQDSYLDDGKVVYSREKCSFSSEEPQTNTSW